MYKLKFERFSSKLELAEIYLESDDKGTLELYLWLLFIENEIISAPVPYL